MPRVSIITPCYNCERYVAQTVASIQAQTFADWEHIIVDDGSPDQSASVVEAAIANEPRAKLIRKPNGGVASARNVGAANIAKDSQYLLFLDADDCLSPEFLAKMVGYLDAHPTVSLVYCDPIFIDPQGERMATTPAKEGWWERWVPTAFGARQVPHDEALTPFVSLYCLATVIPSISLIRRSIYDLVGPWDEPLGHLYEDTDMFLRLALRGEIHHLPEPLTLYRRHPTQSTSNAERIRQQEHKLYRKWKQPMDLPLFQRRMVEQAEKFRVKQFGVARQMLEARRQFHSRNYRKVLVAFTRAFKRFVIPYSLIQWKSNQES